MTIVESQIVARPYAEAAFFSAKAENALADWQKFLSAYALFFADGAIKKYLLNPFVDQSELLKLIQAHDQNLLSLGQQNFLKLLAESRRLINLETISELFNQLADQDAGILRAVVTSPYEIDAETLQRLQQQLAKHFKKTIAIESQINSDLIGGLEIYIGDKVINRSLHAQLEALYHSLIQ